MPEALLVLCGAGLGMGVSIWRLADAVRDVRLVHESDPENVLMMDVAQSRVVDELFRLGLLSIFVGLGIVVIIEVDLPSETEIWMLVAIPWIIAGWSIWDGIRRKRQLEKAGGED